MLAKRANAVANIRNSTQKDLPAKRANQNNNVLEYTFHGPETVSGPRSGPDTVSKHQEFTTQKANTASSPVNRERELGLDRRETG